jgi:hypothetical protein
MVRVIIISFLLVLFLASCKGKINIINPESIDGLIYSNTFDSTKRTVDGGTYSVKKVIHKNSLAFKSNDSTFTRFKTNIVPNKAFSISFWLKPNFYGRNGTIITLSKEREDFPLQSTLSLYMNKNRVAVMQEGKDLRKIDYINQNNFTSYFMMLEELNVNETYFLTYKYDIGKVSILIDGEVYSEYNNVSNLSSFKYITLGASWNKQGGKYYFNGAIDDLYMFNKALNKDEINCIMDFTHIYQYAK